MEGADRDSNLDPLLITVNFVTYMTRRDHLAEEGKLSDLFRHLDKAVKEAMYEFGGECDGYNASVLAFAAGKHEANANRCITCGEWISAQNRPDIIGGLLIGAEHDGAYYCFDHLPPESAWLSSLPSLDPGFNRG